MSASSRSIRGEVTFEGMRVPYEIISSPRRRNVQIEVRPGQGLIVRLPAGVEAGAAQIEQELLRHADFYRAALTAELRAPGGLRAVQTPDGLLTFQLQRRRGRKRVAIHVLPQGTVEVRAPWSTPVRWIDEFVVQHSAWIRQRLADLPPPIQYTTGTAVPFQGERLRLEVLPGLFAAGEIRRKGDRLLVSVGGVGNDEELHKAVRDLLRRWLMQQALEVCRQRVSYWSQRLGVAPAKVTIKDMSTRWGSCSQRGNLSISYRIVMAPPWVMDYLLVHELCHLRHMDHSAAFWAAVKDAFPQADAARRWLREHSAELRL